MHIVLTENCTADGVIDLAAGWFDPTDQPDSQLLAVTRAHMAEQDALLLGRNTFEAFRGFWPKQADDATGITDHLNRVQKYVLSTMLVDPQWEPTTILRNLDEVRALPDPSGTTGRDRQHQRRPAVGGSRPRRRVPPVRLSGVRRRRFRVLASGGRRELVLVEASPFPSGVTLLRYERPR